MRSVRIVELTRADKHNGDNRSKCHDGDDKDPGALDDHHSLRLPLLPLSLPAPTAIYGNCLRWSSFMARSLPGMLPDDGSADGEASTANRFTIEFWNARQPMAPVLPLE